MDQAEILKTLQSTQDALIEQFNALGADTTKVTSAFQGLRQEVEKHPELLAKMALGYGQVRANAALASSDMAQSFNEVYDLAMAPNRIAAAIAGSNVFGMMSDGSAKINQQARDIGTSLDDFRTKLAGDSVAAGEGISTQLNLVYTNQAQLSKSYFTNVLRETRLFNAGLEQLSSDTGYNTAKTTQLLTDGLKVRGETVTALFQDEFSRTGKITGKIVEDYAATVIAAEKVTGVNRQAISDDLQRLVKDFENFGNMSIPQMASLSVAMRQLGFDMEDVRTVSSKFMGFEGATQAISNIAAVTGASLDAMELFYLANEDKEEFFKTLKQNLIEQGVTLENLSHQEQVYLSKQLGFSSVKQLQTLLNSEIEGTTQNYTDMIDAAAESADVRGKALDDELAQSGGLATQMEDAVKNAEKGYQNTLKLYAATEDLAKGMQRLSIEASNNLVAGLPVWNKGMEAVGEGIATIAKTSSTQLQKLGKDFDQLLTHMDPAEIIKRFKPLIGESPSPLMQGVIDGFKSGMEGVKKVLIAGQADMEKLGSGYADGAFKITTPIGAALQKVTEIKSKFKEDSEFDRFVATTFDKEKDRFDGVKRVLDTLDTGLSSEFIDKQLKSKLGDQFTPAQYKSIAENFSKGNEEGLNTILQEISGASITATVAAQAKALETSAATAAVNPTTPAPAAGAASAVEPIVASAAQPTTVKSEVSGEANLTVKVEVNSEAIESIVMAKIVEIASSEDGIVVNTNNGRGTGRVKIVTATA